MTLQDLLGFHDAVSGLKNTQRYTNCTTPVQESVADHTCGVVSLARRTNQELNLGLDMYDLTEMALYHDIGEFHLDEDVDMTDRNDSVTKRKRTLEAFAVRSLAENHGCEDVYRVWEEYSDQKTPLSRFIRAMDKIEAMIHLTKKGFGSGRKEDAAMIATQADKAVLAFPELIPLLRKVKAGLMVMYGERGIKWNHKEYDKV